MVQVCIDAGMNETVIVGHFDISEIVVNSARDLTFATTDKSFPGIGDSSFDTVFFVD